MGNISVGRFWKRAQNSTAITATVVDHKPDPAPVDNEVEGIAQDVDCSAIPLSVPKRYVCKFCRKRFLRKSLRQFGDEFICTSCWKKRTPDLPASCEVNPAETDSCDANYNPHGQEEQLIVSKPLDPPDDVHVDGPPPAKKAKIALDISRCPSSKKRCPFCTTQRTERRGENRLVSIPWPAKVRMYVDTGILLPEGVVCCKKHLENGYISEVDAKQCKIQAVSSELSAKEIEKLLASLRKLAKERTLDFDTPHKLSDEEYIALTGLNENDFNTVFESIRNYGLRNRTGRSIKTCLALFMIKLRTAISHKVIAAIFGMSRRAVGKIIQSVRQALMVSFVPNYLGVSHIDRDTFIDLHTSLTAQTIFYPGARKCILVADATYIYIQKSSNYQFQRRTYSLHKGRPLLKPMLIVSTTGYVLDVFGPYLADGKNNDASILESIMKTQQSALKQWLRESDIFIVDRGFRDCLESLEEMGFHTKMPCFLKAGTQHTTQEANDSRLVTAVRWVIEAENGLLKTWLLLSNVLPNTQIPFAGDYVRIVCALCNAFRPPRISGTYDDVLKAERMLALSKQANQLKELVERNKWDRKRIIYQEVDSSELVDFPKLTLSDLQDLTLGVYQLKQAKSYTSEHLNEGGLYSMSYVKISQNIVHIKIQSRFSSNKQHKLWIRYQTQCLPVSFEWYCKCRAGARVVGCCAHVASVLWFLSYWRHQDLQDTTINARAMASVQDAANSAGWSESSEEESSEGADSD